MSSPPRRPSPTRLLGFPSVLALVVGTFIGSGIFLLPAQLAPLGWNGVAGWIVTIAGAICVATVFAALARVVPRAAGPYAYVEEAYGQAPAFAVAWAYWVSIWVGNAAIAVAAVSYLSEFLPLLASTPAAGAGGAAALLLLLTLVNCLSLKAGGSIQLVTVLIKLVPLGLVMVLTAGILARGTATAVPEFEVSALDLGAVNSAAALTLWALLGFEAASIASRNVRRPEVTVPRAIVAGTLLVGLIYLAVAVPVSLFLPVGEVAASNAPFALFSERFGGPLAGSAMAAFAAVSVIGALNGLVLISGEFPLAWAREGLLPAAFSKVSERGIAVRGILLSTTLSLILIAGNASRSLGGLFAFMALLGTVGALVLYFACCLSALKLMRTGALKRGVLLTAAALLGTVYALWTLWGAGAEATGWGAVLIAAGMIPYALRRRRSMRAAAAEGELRAPNA